jgi:hypothetical protein
MKKIKISLGSLLILFFTITLFSCSSDDDNNLRQIEYSNIIDFDGQTYQISDGNFDDGGNNRFSMALFPIGITFNDDYNVINGGDWYLEIELKTEDNSIEGTYKCGENVFGYFITNAHFVDDELQEGQIVHEINHNGTLSINKLGMEYEIKYNAFDYRGVAFIAYYKGSLTSL